MFFQQALLHFRRPAVVVEKGKAVTLAGQTGAPLSIHHTPVSVTFGFVPLASGEHMAILDPSLEESEVLAGTLSVAVNSHGELCSVQKMGGCAVDADALIRCMQLAAIRASETVQLIRDAVATHHRLVGVPPKRNLIAYLSPPQEEASK